jgi:hypothetical protein
VQLQAPVDDTSLHLAAEKLRCRGVGRRELAFLVGDHALVNEGSRGEHLGVALGQDELGVLESAEWLTEDGPVRHVGRGHRYRGRGCGVAAEGYGEALLGQVAGQVGEGASLVSEQVLRRDGDVAETELDRVLGAKADLVQVAADAEARTTRVDEQDGQAAAPVIAGRCRCAADDQYQPGVRPAGDERLRAVQHPVPWCRC